MPLSRSSVIDQRQMREAWSVTMTRLQLSRTQSVQLTDGIGPSVQLTDETLALVQLTDETWIFCSTDRLDMGPHLQQ